MYRQNMKEVPNKYKFEYILAWKRFKRSRSLLKIYSNEYREDIYREYKENLFKIMLINDEINLKNGLLNLV